MNVDFWTAETSVAMLGPERDESGSRVRLFFCKVFLQSRPNAARMLATQCAQCSMNAPPCHSVPLKTSQLSFSWLMNKVYWPVVHLTAWLASGNPAVASHLFFVTRETFSKLYTNSLPIPFWKTKMKSELQNWACGQKVKQINRAWFHDVKEKSGLQTTLLKLLLHRTRQIF